MRGLWLRLGKGKKKAKLRTYKKEKKGKHRFVVEVVESCCSMGFKSGNCQLVSIWAGQSHHPKTISYTGLQAAYTNIVLQESTRRKNVSSRNGER